MCFSNIHTHTYVHCFSLKSKFQLNQIVYSQLIVLSNACTYTVTFGMCWVCHSMITGSIDKISGVVKCS